MNLTYRNANENDIPTIAKLAANAFEGYPLYESFRLRLPFARYQKLLYDLHLMEARIYFHRHACLVAETEDGKIVAVAMLERPGEKKAGFWTYVAHGGLKLIGNAGPAFVIRFLEVADKTRMACDERYDGSWHLNVLAVKPVYQGRRIGTRMLEECVMPLIANSGGGNLTLTTNTPANARLYARCGFSLVECTTINAEGNTLENWAFVAGIPARQGKASTNWQAGNIFADAAGAPTS